MNGIYYLIGSIIGMPIITTVVNNNTTVTPPQTSGPRLPGSGRDHGVSHFTHAA